MQNFYHFHSHLRGLRLRRWKVFWIIYQWKEFLLSVIWDWDSSLRSADSWNQWGESFQYTSSLFILFYLPHFLLVISSVFGVLLGFLWVHLLYIIRGSKSRFKESNIFFFFFFLFFSDYFSVSLSINHFLPFYTQVLNYTRHSCLKNQKKATLYFFASLITYFGVSSRARACVFFFLGGCCVAPASIPYNW